MEGTLAEIRMFAGSFSPRGWIFCNGSIQSIAQNTALFALVGTTYGGDGQTTFGVPDLRGRVPVGTGNGPGLPGFQLGESGGTNSKTLITTNLPAHNHPLNAVTQAGSSATPTGNLLANTGALDKEYAPAAGNTATAMGATAIGNTGSSTPIDNMQPYLGINYIMCVVGIFPSRN